MELMLFTDKIFFAINDSYEETSSTIVPNILMNQLFVDAIKFDSLLDHCYFIYKKLHKVSCDVI